MRCALLCRWTLAALSLPLSAEQITLFDGKTSQGWRTLDDGPFPRESWEIVDAAMCAIPNAPRPDLATTQLFRNFHLTFEFRLAPRANSGVKYLVFGLRSQPGAVPKALGLELQLIDESHLPAEERNPAHGMGSLYLLQAPETLPPLAPLEWHRAAIRVQGNRVEHWLNGVRVLTADLQSPAIRQALSQQKRPDVPKPLHFDLLRDHPDRRFPIVLTHHGDRACFRNLVIRPD